jgi:hypothetical protein
MVDSNTDCDIRRAYPDEKTTLNVCVSLYPRFALFLNLLLIPYPLRSLGAYPDGFVGVDLHGVGDTIIQLEGASL